MNKKALNIISKDVVSVVDQLKDNFKDISGKTFVITGSSGLLASYIVDTLAYLNEHSLLNKPCTVVGLQRFKPTKSSRLGHLLNRDDVRFIKHDVCVPYDIDFKVDYIIHAAGRSAPAFFQNDPLGTVDVNVSGIRWILEYSSKHKVKSILYMSSGEIYGNPSLENIPTKEDYTGNVSSLAPRACYTESKRLSETLCSIYNKKYNVPVKIARPFIVYGPGLRIDDRRVMADFMRSGIAKKPIKMLNRGLDSRTYCYITDATVLFFRLLFSGHNVTPFNVANNKEEVTIRDLAELVHNICDITKKVTVSKEGDKSFIKDAPSRVFPDISKAKSLLNYDPSVTMKEGLSRTVAWNREIFKA